MRRVSLLSKLIAGSIGLTLVLPANGQLASDLLSGRFKAQGVITAIYTGAEFTPSVVIHVDDIYTDYERKGFFRIGILPVGVLEGVTFEVCLSESVTNALTQLNNWLGYQSTKRLELRRMNLLTFSGSTNRLESSRARMIPNGRWELMDGVRFFSGTNQLSAPRATLQVTGRKTGQLIMLTDPPLTNNLFARTDSESTDKRGTQ